MIDYDSGTGQFTNLYYKGGNDLNGDWSDAGDGGSPYPTSLCAPAPLVNQSFTVAAGGVTNISLPRAVMLLGRYLVETNGIQVTASQRVSVYGMNYGSAVSAAFTVYPTKLLGTNYCLMAYDGDRSEFAVVATENNTTITITPSPTAELGSHTDAYTVVLQQGETYQIQSNGGDVTGTLITSDKSVGVFAGTYATGMPSGTPTANPVVQEQMPVDSWGTQVLAMSFAGRTNGDYYRVLAAYTNTVVLTNGLPAGTIQAGEFLDLLIDGPVEFQASRPIQVAQFACSYSYDAGFKPNPEEGDPCEILLPPTGHYLETNILITLPNDSVTGDFYDNFLNLIVLQSAITNTFVDTFQVAATNFVAIGTSGFYGAQITVPNSGRHTVTSSQPVEVQVYGFGFCDAYSYFGGIVK